MDNKDQQIAQLKIEVYDAVAEAKQYRSIVEAIAAKLQVQDLDALFAKIDSFVNAEAEQETPEVE